MSTQVSFWALVLCFSNQLKVKSVKREELLTLLEAKRNEASQAALASTTAKNFHYGKSEAYKELKLLIEEKWPEEVQETVGILRNM